MQHQNNGFKSTCLATGSTLNHLACILFSGNSSQEFVVKNYKNFSHN